jgi:hypothetical protein
VGAAGRHNWFTTMAKLPLSWPKARCFCQSPISSSPPSLGHGPLPHGAWLAAPPVLSYQRHAMQRMQLLCPYENILAWYVHRFTHIVQRVRVLSYAHTHLGLYTHTYIRVLDLPRADGARTQDADAGAGAGADAAQEQAAQGTFVHPGLEVGLRLEFMKTRPPMRILLDAGWERA